MVSNKLNIALIGYGKMGQTIEKIAEQRGHSIGLIVSSDSKTSISQASMAAIDVAIEFSIPKAAVQNLTALAELKVPTICGTTGWLEAYDKVCDHYTRNETGFLYASNFSLGVNVFFALNKRLAEMMDKVKGYDLSITEAHHVTKLDAPSGTAVSVAQQIIETQADKSDWTLVNGAEKEIPSSVIPIKSVREADVKGMHEVTYSSPIDNITIKHEAFSREGFALGAVLAVEFIHNKKAIHSLAEVLDL